MSQQSIWRKRVRSWERKKGAILSDLRRDEGGSTPRKEREN